jgi:hypothetical protein
VDQPELGVDDRAHCGEQPARAVIDPVALQPPLAERQVEVGKALGAQRACELDGT